eukprot:15495711-Heterocapsa_arctica.AAC.1
MDELSGLASQLHAKVMQQRPSWLALDPAGGEPAPLSPAGHSAGTRAPPAGIQTDRTNPRPSS